MTDRETPAVRQGSNRDPTCPDGLLNPDLAKASSLRIFQLAKTFRNPGLKVGEKVSVNWDMSGKNKTAESATLVK